MAAIKFKHSKFRCFIYSWNSFSAWKLWMFKLSNIVDVCLVCNVGEKKSPHSHAHPLALERQ